MAVLPVEAFILLKNTHEESFDGLWLPYGPSYMFKNAWLRNILDYLKDPWTFEELLLRATRFQNKTLSWNWNENEYQLNDEILSSESGQVSLSPAESALLKALIQRHGRPVSRELLGKEVWGSAMKPDSRFLDIAISTLRKKIITITEHPLSSPIKSIRGCGYLLP